MIEFRTLGTLQLTGADGVELRSVVAQPKPLALLCYLVLHSPDGYHRRDTLLGLLWPEYPEQRARHALSQALHVLRQELGEGVVVTRGKEDIGIDRARLWCDAAAFAEAIERRDYEAALALYGGDLLEGFFVSEAAGFERWLGNERIRLQELAAGAAWRLAQRRIDEAGLVEAERTAQRALSLVPTDESEVRRFVAALANAGDRAAAIRFYEKFADRLRDEYELEPAPETKQLIEAVRNRSDAVVAVEPAYREASPVKGDAAPAVQGATQEEQAVARRASGFPVRWVAVAASVLLIGLAVAVAVSWISRSRAEGAVFVPNRVVVSLFENQTGDSSLAPIALMAADWITDGLARTGMVEVITPAAVRDAFAAAASEGTALFGSSGLLTLAESMHAGVVVLGRLYRAADDLMLRAEVVRMPGVSALGPIEPVSLQAEDPGPALETIRQRVMGLLAIKLHPRLAEWAKTVRQPPKYEAYLEFEAGLGLVPTPGRSSDMPVWKVQIQHMLKSAALDTTFMAPLVQLLKLSLGIKDIETRMRFCDSVVQVVRQRQHFLAPGERYEIAASEALWRGDRAGVYMALRRAAEVAPDRFTEVAIAAFYDGRYRETVEILQRPDLPIGLRGYPWKALTASLHFLGEHERELDAARRGRREYPGSMNLMEQEATALAALGRIEELNATLEDGFVLGTDAEGMNWTNLFFQAGNELLWHDYESEGRAVLERVVEESRKTGARQQLARSLLFLGRHEEARAIFEQLASEGQAAGGNFAEWLGAYGFLGFAAMAAAGQGDRETAMRISEQLAVQDGFATRRAGYALLRAQIAGALGDCGTAVGLVKEALQLGRGHCFIHRRYGLMNCRDYPPFQEVAKPRG